MTAILVTGAGGFIGYHLARAGQRAGWRVTAVDRRPMRLDGPETIQADAGDPVLLDRIRRGEFAAVLHHAAISDTLNDRWDALEATNVALPLALADACATSGTRFLYASSGSVYGSIRGTGPVREEAVDDRARCSGPLNPYAQSKLLLDEQMTRLSGDLAWVGLRYTNVFGPGEEHKGPMASILSQLLRQAAGADPITLFNDSLLAARDYLPIDALVHTVTRLVHTPVPPGVYNLGAGHAVSFATALQWCAALRDDGLLDVRLIPNPIPHRYQYWTCADVTALRAALPGLAPVTVDDVRAAATDLYESFDSRS